ncbi:hypothetical protein B6I21_02450 [candidate division KSB1 bacterium 4572_119]|nr:MAG: hypothetical protein B6I21_02450 [candidate division KSB1 bacterium 4572_119]
MTFLNSAILLGLLAGAIPIIIHLITRQKAKTIFFSSLKFLKKLENQQIRRLRMKQILLLLIRTLIILLLILAFARPTIRGTFFAGVGASAKTTAVLVLDNSLSMGVKKSGQQLYDYSKRAVSELEDVFNTGDEVFGIYSTESTTPIFDGARYNFQTVNRIIQNSNVTGQKSDLPAALFEAKKILESSNNINKEIFIFSDFQLSGFEKSLIQNQTKSSDEKVSVYIVPSRSEKISNLAIREIKSANQIIEKGKVVELQVQIKNTGQKIEKNKLVQAFLDNKRTGQKTVNLKPGESRMVKFKIIPKTTGYIAGSVLLEDDDLTLDNRRYFTFYIPEKIRVLLVGSSNADVRFLKFALNPSTEDEARIEVNSTTPNNIEYAALKKYDVVILSNVSRLEGALETEIAEHLKKGKGLIVFLGSNVDLRNYNEKLQKIKGMPQLTETVGKIGTTDFSLSLGKVDFSHPIFEGVFENEDKQIDSPMFYFITKTIIRPENTVVMEFSTGDPFLIETSFKNGKALLFTSAIDPEWSDIYLKGVFVPMMNRCVSYLGNSSASFSKEYFVNNELTWTLSDLHNYENLEAETPDGRLLKVIPHMGDGKVNVKFKNTEVPGIYSLYNAKKLVSKLAVNVKPEESEFEMAAGDRLKELLGDYKIVDSEKEMSVAREVNASRYGREFWKLLIVMVFILLIAEMLLAKEKDANSKTTGVRNIERTT